MTIASELWIIVVRKDSQQLEYTQVECLYVSMLLWDEVANIISWQMLVLKMLLCIYTVDAALLKPFSPFKGLPGPPLPQQNKILP